MQKKRYLADAIGLVALMVMVVILASFVSSSDIAKPLWLPIYLAWAAGALFLWYKFDAVRWWLVAASSIGGAILWYLATRGIAQLVFRSGEPELSRVFDITVALILSPAVTFVAIAGHVRELAYKKFRGSSLP